MDWKIVHIDETDSTNRWLRERGGEEDMVVVADYQTAGRGCGTNSWESERGKNLLFSVLYHPQGLAANRQFEISMAMSLALCDALGNHIGDLSVKWPNDIYWRNAKIAGILIENRLKGDVIRDSIIGVGLNVNQQTFSSGAPNPISLLQIHGQETNRDELLGEIMSSFSRCLGEPLRERYLKALYRRQGFHPYADADGAFMAELADVEPTGRLVLRLDTGEERRYAFKEVAFVI